MMVAYILARALQAVSKTPPTFVGNDYFCESGCPGHYERSLFPDPLWDKEGLETVCCQAAGLPWFHKRISAPTYDYIETRICANQAADIPVG